MSKPLCTKLTFYEDNAVLILFSFYLFQILESITENIEEIEEEFLVFRDLSHHANLPSFYGLFLKRGPTTEDDQLWFVMEVCIRYCLITILLLEIYIDLFTEFNQITSI